MKIKLFDYQQKAIDNIFGKNGLFTKGKRFAAVILPTGGGKSYVALQSILNCIEIEENIKQGIISKTPVCYLAPNTTLLYQFKLNIAQNVIANCYIEKAKNELGIIGEIPEENAEEYVSQIIESVIISFKNVMPNYKGKLEYKEFYSKNITHLSPDEFVDKVIKKNILELGLEESVDYAFPNFKCRCYQSLKSREGKIETQEVDDEDVKEEDIIYVEDMKEKVMVIDEAHRASASGWQRALEIYASNNKDTKYIAITATIDRDGDDRNFLQKLAQKTGYTLDETLHNKFYAFELGLIDAMKQKLVVTPEVMYFPWLLDETKEYLTAINKYLSVSQKIEKKHTQSLLDELDTYTFILSQMHKTMGMDDTMSKERLELLRKSKLSKIKSINELCVLEKNDELKRGFFEMGRFKERENTNCYSK